MGEYGRAGLAQTCVIGSMLIDDRCVPLVLSKLREEDFTDSTCRNFFRAIRELAMEGRPIDPVPVLGKLKGGDDYVPWYRETMDITVTAANVEEYIRQVLESSMLFRFRALCDSGMRCQDSTEAAELARKMSIVFSATDRMPMMTAVERATDFYQRMQRKDKPKYLPWGFPTIDRTTYAELGDMILLGGYSSSGKTLLSILMAAALSHVPLEKIKDLNFSESDWDRLWLISALCARSTSTRRRALRWTILPPPPWAAATRSSMLTTFSSSECPKCGLTIRALL